MKEVFHEAFPEQAVGYIAKSSWIQTFFVEKQYDQKFAQQTLQVCMQTIYTMLRTGKIRQMSPETMSEELSLAIFDVLRNLIPQIKNGLEFCGLIKGVWRFNSLCVLCLLGELQLPKTPKKKLNLEKYLLQAQRKIRLLPSDTRRNLLAQAILSVCMAYQELTNSTIAMPKWIQAYYEEYYKK